MTPPKIDEIVDLYLNMGPATTIPQDGYVEYIFPEQIKQVPFETEEGCVLVSLPS